MLGPASHVDVNLNPFFLVAVSVLLLAVVWNLVRNPHPGYDVSRSGVGIRTLVAVPVLLLAS